MILFIQYPPCSTCQKAKKWLDGRGAVYTDRHIKEQNPSYEELKNDISIRGAFFRELLPLLESENEEERRTAADALKYGLAALDGNDVIDF